MLEHIHIKNYALIDELFIEFKKGLNILTGETGAGKSIIINALSLLLGDNIDKTFIKDINRNVIVEGVVITENDEIISFIKEIGIEIEENTIFVKRIYIPSMQKNKFFINDTIVSKKTIEYIFSNLVDLIGQHEHQSLLDLKNHIKYLDKFAKIEDKVLSFKEKFIKLKKLEENLKELKEKEQERNRKRDYLKYSIDEIEKANLTEEDENLFEERKIISNLERIVEVLSYIHKGIKEDEYNISQTLYSFITGLKSIKNFDKNFPQIIKILEDVDIKLQEVSDFCVNYIDNIDYSEERVNYLDQRISLIETLKRKYGDTIEQIIEFKNNAEKELELIENSENTIEEIQKDIEKLRKELIELAIFLSRERTKNAKKLERILHENLKKIGMEKTKFIVKISHHEDENSFFEINGRKYKLYQYGIDFVEFGIAPNLGEKIKPLRKIASGGEISRIMLSLKLALSMYDSIETFIFDEVDTGIGGNTANLVGKMIKKLSFSKQIICITHLPQIASLADHHIYIEKEFVENKTKIVAKVVEGEEKIKEIARMLSGNPESKEALVHAKTLIKENENEE